MKNQLIVTLLIFCMSATVGMAQTKKPTTTKKTTTTVQTSPSKTSTVKKTTTTTTPVTPPVVVDEKKTTTTTPTNQTTTSSSTTTIQSSGPSKGKKTAEPKPEKVKEPKPERVKTPRDPYSSSGGVKFGIRAEATQLVSFETGGQPDFSPGVNAGLIINIPVSGTFAIQPEILYSMGVVKASDPTTKTNFVKYTSNSILAPIMLNFNLGSGSTKFMISPGGYADYALSASTSQSIGGVTQSGSIDLTGVDKFGYGAVLGLGVKLNGNFLIEARSFYDLKTSNNKSIFATFGIGYMF
jgi:Outer membrane protein beta-barrel domain